MSGLSFPRAKQTVRNNEVSVKRGLTVLEFSVPSSSLRSRRLEVAGERVA